MYSQCCENVRSLEDAIDKIESALRLCIAKQEAQHIYSFTKILSYLVVCWCEARIMKMVHEPEFTYTTKKGTFTKRKSFNSSQIEYIISAKTLKDKWVRALQVAVGKGYNVNINSGFPNNLAFTSRSRYLELKRIIDDELLPSIEVRNRIAHGQWKHAFTNDLKSLSQPITSELRTENMVVLQMNYSMFKALALLINDLASSIRTFERDFDKNYQIIEQNMNNLHHRDFSKYSQQLIEKYKRGQLRRP